MRHTGKLFVLASIILLVGLVSLAGASANGFSQAAPSTPQAGWIFAPDAAGNTRIIIHYRDTNSPLPRLDGGQVVFSDEQRTVLSIPAASAGSVLAALSADANVSSAQPDVRVQAALTPNDPYFVDQWALGQIDAPGAWDKTTGSGIVIAVVDTGVNRLAEFGDRLRGGWNEITGTADVSDDNGHGTAVAAVAAAAGNNATGSAGMCWGCQILPVKVLAADGSGWASDVAAGVTYAADHGAQIINLSLGCVTDDPDLASAIEAARARGVIVVAASGNAGDATPQYPAADPGVFSVAASDRSDALYSWSSSGNWVDFAAPGEVLAPKPDGSYQALLGSSFAAPLLSGTLALMLSLAPKASFDTLVSALAADAVPVSGAGYGRIDAAAALARLGGGAASPVPTSSSAPSNTPSTTASPVASPSYNPEPTPAPTLSPGFSLRLAAGGDGRLEAEGVYFSASHSGSIGLQPGFGGSASPVVSWGLTLKAQGSGWWYPDGLIGEPQPTIYLEHLAGAPAAQVTLTPLFADGTKGEPQTVELISE